MVEKILKSFKIEDDEVYVKYKSIWKKIKNLLSGIRLNSISIDSVLKIDKKWFPQVYLEQCKYKIKERKIKSLIDYDLDSNYESN